MLQLVLQAQGAERVACAEDDQPFTLQPTDSSVSPHCVGSMHGRTMLSESTKSNQFLYDSLQLAVRQLTSDAGFWSADLSTAGDLQHVQCWMGRVYKAVHNVTVQLDGQGVQGSAQCHGPAG